MTTPKLYVALTAGLLFAGISSTVVAQTDTQDHTAHHPVETQATPAPAAPGAGSAPAMPGGMPGMMGMMTPEMMQMMQRMMSQGGMPGPGMARGGAAHDDMGRGQMPMVGDMMMCPMMRTMMHDRGGAARHGMMGGPSNFHGMPHGPDEMTPDRVRALLDHQLKQLGNPRLKIGQIARAADANITAEIVTVDGSLVQKLAFNRYPGLVRQITD